MKQISSSISEFINAFNLSRDDGVICFDATIYYSTRKKSIQLPSEVHIVTIGHKQLDVIYLLHPDVAKLGIPDLLENGRVTFSYLPEKALIIKGNSSTDGMYTLSVHPANADCSEKTLAEIHAKTYN
ncbi:MAG: hypothetical protein V4556_08055 [Bacteroidota bacterium]